MYCCNIIPLQVEAQGHLQKMEMDVARAPAVVLSLAQISIAASRFLLGQQRCTSENCFGSKRQSFTLATTFFSPAGRVKPRPNFVLLAEHERPLLTLPSCGSYFIRRRASFDLPSLSTQTGPSPASDIVRLLAGIEPRTNYLLSCRCEPTLGTSSVPW